MDKILLLEDDEMLNAGLCYNLDLEGYKVIPAFNVNEAKLKFDEGDWAMLLVDVTLPDGTGFEFGEWVRERSDVPFMFLTGNDLDEDMVRGFDVGADDYVTKPFNIKVVLKRINAIINRGRRDGGGADTFTCGNIFVDLNSQSVQRSGEAIDLTPTEYKLLLKFIKNSNTVLTREMLLDKLWDQNGNFVDDHTLTINVSRLRNKISDEQFKYIKTVYGTGYQWVGDKE